MEMILKNKLTIIFAVFGALFAFVLSVISRAYITDIIIRFFIGAIIMGAIGFVLDVFLIKALPNDEYTSLMNEIKVPWSNSRYGETGRSEMKQNISKIDFIDKTDADIDNDYGSMYKDDIKARKTANSDADMDRVFDNPITEGNSADKEIDETPISYSGIKREDNDEEVEVYKEKSDDINEDLTKLGEVKKEEQLKQASKKTRDDVQFKMGNKKVSIDSKLIAKAIKTVINRE